jgi:hypothetical protein
MWVNEFVRTWPRRESPHRGEHNMFTNTGNDVEIVKTQGGGGGGGGGGIRVTQFDSIIALPIPKHTFSEYFAIKE